MILCETAQTYIKSVLYSPTYRHYTKHATQRYWSTLLRFVPLQMFHNRFIGMGVTWLITMGKEAKSTMRLGVKESSWKEEEEWFEPDLNIHTTISTTITTFFLFTPFELNRRKKKFFHLAQQPPQWAMASSFSRFLDHTQRRSTFSRTPLDEWSARRRDLYLTTHNTHNRETSIPPEGFDPTISAGERPQTCALDRAATGIGKNCS